MQRTSNREVPELITCFDIAQHIQGPYFNRVKSQVILMGVSLNRGLLSHLEGLDPNMALKRSLFCVSESRNQLNGAKNVTKLRMFGKQPGSETAFYNSLPRSEFHH